MTPDRNQLIGPHIPALRRFAWALCRNGHDADDLVQDCLVRALDRWQMRRTDASLRAWLFAILHNGFVSVRRQSGRRPVVPLESSLTEPGVEGAQEHTLALRDISVALESLPDEQRAVLLLVGVEDLSYQEAALVLDVPIGTVMSRLSRGRERLRRVMAGDRPAALWRVV